MTAHVFDMDGTLLRGTTASLLLAEVLGRRDELEALEATFAGGGQSNADFARALHATWGVVEPHSVRAAFEAAPILGNVAAVLEDIRRRGEHACLITMSPDYLAELLLPLGFDAVYASRFPRDAGAEIDPAQILTFEDKPRLAHEFCRARGLRLEDAVAYGDSMSDVPLFNKVGLAIAVNADHHLAGLSDVDVQTDDLQDAYRHARAFIDGG